MLGLVAPAAPQGGVEADPPPASLPEARAPSPTLATPTEPVLVEACDGTRTPPTEGPRALGCSRWTIAWREGGTPWGFVVADSYDAVIAERERQLGFARRYARFFEVPLDERYADPGPPVCDACTSEPAAGRWGEGQKFGDGAARRAIAGAEAELRALDAALGEHLPHLEDIARLARESEVSKPAKEYAKQLRLAVLDTAKARLVLDDAAVFRSEPKAKDAGTMARARVESLAAAATALRDAVGTAVGKAHGGKYLEDADATGKAPFLQIDFEGAKVTATYVLGDARSTWFEGTVALDGSISGRSLLAPESGKLTCQAHTADCGYVYIDSVLRFTERKAGDTAQQVAELWFRRSQWVMAKPFLR